ncbi:hypothetical protein CGZ97_18170 [Enemella evansiae]|nr:hypothetical protein CGZ97_18170 [Enemella evansiae]OYO07406.1 hypothetical protein CGZ98_18250 [Enemella evansiae]
MVGEPPAAGLQIDRHPGEQGRGPPDQLRPGAAIGQLDQMRQLREFTEQQPLSGGEIGTGPGTQHRDSGRAHEAPEVTGRLASMVALATTRSPS